MARNLHLDAARGILITLVVIGHCLESSVGGLLQGWNAEPQASILAALYVLHMPAFAFTVGLFARRSKMAGRLVSAATWFVIFDVIYAGPFVLKGDQAWYEPGYALWFLIAMFVWTLAVPLIERAPAVAMAGAIVLCLLAGSVDVDGSMFAWVRTLTTLPFFVAGAIVGLGRVPSTTVRSRQALAGAVGLAAMVVTSALVGDEWIRGSYSFAEAGAGVAEGIGMRAVVLAASAVTVYAFFVATSAVRSDRLVTAGVTSLSIYLLHIGFVIVLAYVAGHLPGSNVVHAAGAAVFGIALAQVLAYSPIDKRLRLLGAAPLTFIQERRAREFARR